MALTHGLATATPRDLITSLICLVLSDMDQTSANTLPHSQPVSDVFEARKLTAPGGGLLAPVILAVNGAAHRRAVEVLTWPATPITSLAALIQGPASFRTMIVWAILSV